MAVSETLLPAEAEEDDDLLLAPLLPEPSLDPRSAPARDEYDAEDTDADTGVGGANMASIGSGSAAPLARLELKCEAEAEA
ncbi:hypothetical protein GGI14_000537 [Coemansia sp. S680]|nr:hypothetical protein GGI14_000537 [Coemansia sp. S680]